MQGITDDKFISAEAADRLIAAHDGDVALLYLYIRRHGADTEGAARALCRTRGEMEAALEKLERMGLLDEASAAPAQAQEKLPPADKLPDDYRAADIVSRKDRAFTALVQEAQNVLGHSLSTPDLKTLFGVYDYLRLPPEVIMELLHYCVGVSSGRRPTMRFIEREAFAWANREIFTLDQVSAYIEAQQRRREQSAEAARALGIAGRELSATEKRYIAAWLDMGFTPELIAVAYDRTVTNTGALKWGYLNKILQSWQEKGLFTPEDVEARDPRRRPDRAPKPEKKPRNIAGLLDALDKI